MKSKLYIPYFKDGEFLTETELYQLVGFSLDLQWMNRMTHGQVGFFAPDGTENTWNFFEQSHNYLTIHSLYAISPEGIPVVLTEPRRLDLSEVTIDRTTLYASIYFANHSQAFDHELFAPTMYDKEGQPVRNAYQIALHWGEGTALEIAGTTRYSMELGRMTGVDSEEFRVTPLAFYSSGLPELKAGVASLVPNLEAYMQFLFEPTLAPNVDRSLLIEKLEQLLESLSDPFTPTQKCVAEVEQMLRVMKGFYLRLMYARDSQNPLYQQCKGLTRRVLEQQLDTVFEVGKDALSEAIGNMLHLFGVKPSTGYEQIQFFKQLVEVFEIERSKALFESLMQRKAAPPPPRQKQEPGGPRIIPLDPKKS